MNKQPRKLVDVLGQILAVMPDRATYDGFVDLKAGLRSVRRSASCTAPEVMFTRWQLASEYIEDYFGCRPATPGKLLRWEAELIRIWRDEPEAGQ